MIIQDNLDLTFAKTKLIIYETKFKTDIVKTSSKVLNTERPKPKFFTQRNVRYYLNQGWPTRDTRTTGWHRGVLGFFTSCIIGFSDQL